MYDHPLSKNLKAYSKNVENVFEQKKFRIPMKQAANFKESQNRGQKKNIIILEFEK